MDTTHGPRLRGLAALAVLAALAAGCGSGSGDDPAPGGGTSQQVDLDGSWHLVSGRDAEGTFVLRGREVTLKVDGRDAGGTSACNLYGTEVTVDGDAVRFGAAMGTEMACEPPVMELERRYLAGLQAVERAERTEETLTLSGPDVVLELELDPPVRDAALVGTTWVLESLIDGETVSSTMGRGTLVLAEDGTLTGSSGCRILRGSYELDGDRLVVGELLADPAAGRCAEGAEAQHDHVVGVLRDGPTVAVQGDRLTLTARDGQGLDLRGQ